MTDPSLDGPMPPNPNLKTTTSGGFGPLPFPPIDPTVFSDTFISDLDLDGLEFIFDDLQHPTDTEDFFNSLSSPIAPSCSNPIQFTTDPSPDIPENANSGGFDHFSADQSSSGALSPGSCQVSGDRSLDVAKFLNVPSPESSQESATKGSGVSGRASSHGSGNCGYAFSGGLNPPSPDSRNCRQVAMDDDGAIDQKIKLEDEGGNCLLKRKKESEDVNSEPRTSKYQRSNIGGDQSSQPCGISSTSEEEDDKRKARLMRNRESAQLSRQRKKHYVGELEDKVRTMHSTIQDLNTKISYIIAENASLRQQFSGGAMCRPPPMPPPGMYPHPPPMAPMGCTSWMVPPYLVKPQRSQVPLVPIPRLKPQQQPSPAPAPKAKKVDRKKAQGRTKSIASVSFLGLLFFFLLFGELVPMVNVNFGGMWGTVSDGSDYLGNGFYEQHRGRVLTVNDHLNGSNQNIGMGLSYGRFGSGNDFSDAIHSRRGGFVGGAESNIEQKEGSQPVFGPGEVVRPGNSNEPLVASLYVPRNDKLVKIDGNLIIHSVPPSEKSIASRNDHGMKSSEETGLAVSENMPPAIPLIGNGRHPHLYRKPSEQQRALGSGSANKDNSKSKMIDGKLQQWFQEGLAGPTLSSGMCTEVFQFDTSPASGAIVPATSVINVSAERRHQNVTNLTKKRRKRNRRILPGTRVVFAGRSGNNTTKDHTGRRNAPEKERIPGNNNSLSSMVVSVLVDPREAGDVDVGGVMMGPKSLSRIFVVVLADGIRYVTYSCMLPLSGSGAPLVTT